MRYRKLSPSGDYQFGHQQADFYIDQPEAVGQAIKTRLGLLKGEWWLDLTDGTPWNSEILGANTRNTRDSAIQARILATQGVLSILAYTSLLNEARQFNVAATINTIYGEVSISEVL